MTHFPKDFYRHLKEHNYTEVKGGNERKTFLEIWVVTVGKRVFARSWNKSERSWFTELQKTGIGQLKYGNAEVIVTGRKVDAESKIHSLINDAYRARFKEEENIFYVNGICQPEYSNYTMEFFNTEK
jgi:hypothetical protein